MLNSQISPQWTNLILYKRTNLVNFLSIKKQKKTKKKGERVCNIYFWPACKVVKLKDGDFTLWTSLFMFHVIFFSPHFIVHVSSHFLQSTLHWSCFIFISFSPQSISFISPTTVHLVHVYLIWLYSYYMIIQPHCQFHISANPVSRN